MKPEIMAFIVSVPIPIPIPFPMPTFQCRVYKWPLEATEHAQIEFFILIIRVPHVSSIDV